LELIPKISEIKKSDLFPFSNFKIPATELEKKINVFIYNNMKIYRFFLQLIQNVFLICIMFVLTLNFIFNFVQ
jgi:hypothetical protein